MKAYQKSLMNAGDASFPVGATVQAKCAPVEEAQDTLSPTKGSYPGARYLVLASARTIGQSLSWHV